MRKTYRKNIRRTITASLSRFGAILAIVALGVGFLTGLLSSTPDMRYSGDVYFDGTALFDVRVLSTMGLTDDDVAALRKVEGVGDVMPADFADEMVVLPDDTTAAARFSGLPFLRSDTPYLNRVQLTAGRLPQTVRECVLVQTGVFAQNGLKIGDKIRLQAYDEDSTLRHDAFTVVGIVTSSGYFSIEKEATTIGNGAINVMAFVDEAAFTQDYYTNVYLSLPKAQALTGPSDAYDDCVDEAAARIEAIEDERSAARLAQVKQEAEDELADAQQELDDAEAEAEQKLADAEKKLTDGEKEIRENEQKLADAKTEIDNGRQALADGRSRLAAETAKARRQLQQAADQLEEARQALAAAEEALPAVQAGLAQQQAALPAAQAAVQAAAQETQAKRTALAAAQQELDEAGENATDEQRRAVQTLTAEVQAAEDAEAAAQQELQILQGNIAALQAKVAEMQQAIAYLPVQIAEGEAQLAQGKAQLQAQTQAAEAQFAAAEAELADGEAKYQDGMQKLADAKKELAQGRKDFTRESADARRELADAREEIDTARADIAALEKPEWIVQTRSDNTSYASFVNNIEKVDAVAKVFPLFFFLVAALVALTTMTRMVEEERLQIGAMKALGYGKFTIMAKYVLYALCAGLLGSALGIGVGFWLFPTVIWNAYTMMYTLPRLYCRVEWGYALGAAAAAVLCTLAATLNACWATLREKPAQLLLPKAPKAGKRILLERVTPVWRRMKFTHKVTARNLFRYKKRFWMTALGIAGCTALLLAGFGLHDSIHDIVYKQFGQINTYDILAAVKEPEDLQGEELQAVLHDTSLVANSMAAHQEAGHIRTEDGDFRMYLFVPEEEQRLPDFITLRHRLTGEKIPFDANGVVITEKISERTGIKAGDTVTLVNKDGKTGRFVVADVCETYIENYAYMTAETYREQFGTQPQMSVLLTRLAQNDKATRETVSTRLLTCDGVMGLNVIDDLKTSFSNMMGKVDIIVVVLVISAAALAFIVLYNLTNINITERTKEIATIKVLGFTDKEVSAYVYRENVMLSLIGTLLGLCFGAMLHRFVVLSIEMENIMFGRIISPWSYVYAAALTLLFSSLVNVVMHRKLRKISMVESMKAPE